jgi:serine protease AprX
MRNLLLFLFVMLPFFSEGQARYFVYLKDKAGSSGSIGNPSAFLSQRAIDRREAQNITITGRDIPVSKTYLDEIEKLGFKIIGKSKWLNAVLVDGPASQFTSLKTLAFVSGIEGNGDIRGDVSLGIYSRLRAELDSPIAPINYGSSANQIKMLGADTMHAAGFTGEGILIAVMDAGFPNVNTADAFAHLRAGNKIKHTYNYVYDITNVYRDNSHGTNVLSIIGGLLPGKLIGTAPGADFALYTTEDTRNDVAREKDNESKIEEVYWAFAAEHADSLGVDIINSSLGYSRFQDPSQNYTYEDMDGQTTIMVHAANYATQVGIIVVNSAGNEGNSTWKYISTPADGDHVIAVGAVTSGKIKAGFSSFGPSADGRIKPDVTAMGQGTYYSNSGSTISNALSGTSFSAPLISGFMAGLKQQFPTLTSLQLRELLIRSADRYYKPDNEYGYGIPSYTRAVQVAYEDYILLGNETKEELAVLTYPNPISDGETLKIKVGGNTLSENQTVNLTDNSGRIVYKQVNLKSLNLKPLSSGIYHLSFNLNQKNYSQKLVIKK